MSAAALALPGGASAAGTLQGSGTTASPYLIASDADLDTAIGMIDTASASGGVTTDTTCAGTAAGAVYELTANLDYSQDQSVTVTGGQGTWPGISYFCGTFNGDGFTISNVRDASQVANTIGSSFNAAGLFAVANQATIENLGLTNVTVSSGSQAVGAIAGAAWATTLTGDSVVNSTVTSTYASGGGYGAGAIVGYAWGDDQQQVSSDPNANVTTVNNDVASGDTVNTGNDGGGLIGATYDGVAIQDDALIGDTINETSNAAISNSYAVGGIVGDSGSGKGTGGTLGGKAVMASDVLDGVTIHYADPGSESGFSSPTVGIASSSYDHYSVTNVLVGSTFSTNNTGSPLSGTAGTAVSAQALASETTYDSAKTTTVTDPGNGTVTFPGLGWDFTTPVWGWDTYSQTPYLDFNGAVTLPSVTLSTTTLSYYSTSAPTSPAAILTALGATATPSGATVSLDLEGNTLSSFTTPGTYDVAVDVAQNGIEGAPQQATITVSEPPVTISLATAALTYASDNPPSSTAAILAALDPTVTPSGATVSLDLEGNTLASFSTPGIYQVAVDATANGINGTPQQATITIEASPVISTALTSVDYALGANIGAQQFLSDIGASLSNPGTLTADLSGVNFSAAGSYSATISGTDDNGLVATPATVQVNVIDPPAGTTGTPPNGVTPGAVLITGTPQVGSQLTAMPGTWSPSGTPSYQWLENGTPLSGATGSTYTPQPADGGQLMQVAVTEDGVTVYSNPVTIASAILTGSTPTISGTPQVGDSLVAESSWTPSDAATIYQWLLNGQPIAGANSATYTLQSSDADGQISVQVTAGLYGYTNLTLTSQAEEVEPQSNGAVTPGVVKITGTAEIGKTLTADPGTWTPAGSPTYQWVENGTPLAGATSSTYTPGSSEAGDTLYVAVTEDGETVDSATVVIASSVITGQAPTITGTATVGDVLTAAGVAWSPSTASTTYQWYRNGVAIPNATEATYTLQPADAGQPVTVEVTGSLGGYTSVTLASAAVTAQAAGSPETVPGTPTLSGTPQVGQTLAAVAGTWSPAGSPTYQWLENGNDIPGATSATYAVQPSDGGQLLQVAVTEDGEVVYSAPVNVQFGVLTGATPVISGTATTGDTLTATGAAWTPSAAATGYQWLRNGDPIAGATGSTYTLTSADAGQKISVSVTGGLTGYSQLTLTSAQVAVQAAAATNTNTNTTPTGTTPTGTTPTGTTPTGTTTNPTPTPSSKTLKAARPAIRGRATVGATLSIAVGKWTAKTRFAYQWYANGKKLKGAAKQTLKLTPADKGKRISVKVKGTLKGYATRTEASAQTAAVKPAKAGKS